MASCRPSSRTSYERSSWSTLPAAAGSRRRPRRDLRIHSVAFKQHQHPIQLCYSLFQLADGVSGQFLRRRQLVRVFERVFLDPLEAVELELLLLHLGNVEASPTVLFRVARLA